MPQMTPTRRSELLTALLTEQNRPQQIVNPWQLLAQLGAQGIRQSQINRLQKAEKGEQDASEKRIADALAGMGGRQNIELEGVDGSETISIPQKVGVEGKQRLAGQFAAMSPQERLTTTQLAQAEKDLGAPTALEMAEYKSALEVAAANAKTTTNQKEYATAQEQGFTGTLADFIKMTRRSTTVTDVGPYKLESGYMLKDPSDPFKGVMPIPGGSQDTLAPENAAKVQLLETALSSSQSFKKYMVNEDGTINRENIAFMMFNTPFSQGREANVYLLDSIEAKLRAESGAAVPETEVKRAGKRFRPSVFDSDSTVMIKIELLQDFLSGAFNKSQRDGRFDAAGTIDAMDEAYEAKIQAIGDNRYDYDKVMQQYPDFSDMSPEKQARFIELLGNEESEYVDGIAVDWK